jgi:hypothetical protein
MTDRKELLAKADELQLDYAKNISTIKLEELVTEAMEKANNPPDVDESEFTQPKEESSKEVKPASKLSLAELRRESIKNAKAKAFASSVVTLTNRDNRENDFMTTAYLSFENQHFGLSKLVPLDVPVELEQALIDVAEAAIIPLHKDEIVAGKRTGNKVTVRVKKFAISYSKQG